MPLIKVKKPFKFAHFGYHVEEFEPSDDTIETTDECADLAIAEGWATKAKAAAPENKDAAAKRDTKTESAE